MNEKLEQYKELLESYKINSSSETFLDFIENGVESEKMTLLFKSGDLDDISERASKLLTLLELETLLKSENVEFYHNFGFYYLVSFN